MGEVEFCLKNAITSLKSVECKNRDFYAGKCQAFEEIMRVDELFRNKE